MRRTVFLVPSADDVNSGTNYDGSGFTFMTMFPNGSPYGETPLVTLAQAWRDAAYDDLAEVTPGNYCGLDTNCSYGSVFCVRQFGAKVFALVKLEPPPTLVLFRRVKFHCWMDYAGTHGNNWVFPPDNAHGPRAKLAVYNREHTAVLTSPDFFECGYDGATGDPAGNRYCNMNQPNCGGGHDGPIHMEWETFSHPSGGPWTQEDMNELVAGVYAEIADPGWLPEQPFPRLRFFHFYIEIDVEDLGGFVFNLRHAGSLDLRLLRRARNTVSLQLPDTSADRDLFATFYVSHPRGPAVGVGGWGERRLERRALQLVERTYWPESLRVVEQGFDLRDFSCLTWGVFRIDCAWTPELNGVCYLQQGSDFALERDQDGWSARPGDGCLMRVLEDFPVVSRDGLACQGGDDVAISLRNYDPGQPGWSPVDFSGDTSTATSTTLYLVDELGYQSAQVLTFGPSGGKGGFIQSLGALPAAAGDVLNVRAVARVLSDPDPATRFLEYVLSRTGARSAVAFTEFWNAAARTWDASPVYNPIPAGGPSGEIILDAVPLDDPLADADPGYSHQIGRFSSDIADCVFVVGLTDVQQGGASHGASYGTRTPLVTLDAPLTRLGSHFSVSNPDSVRSYDPDRGMLMFEFRPFWRSASLPDATIKPLLMAYSAGDIDRFEFVRESGGNKIRLRRIWAAGTKTVEVAIPDIDRSYFVRVWARWLGEDGWDEHAPFSMQIGWARFVESTGVFVDEAKASAANQTGTVENTDWFRVGSDDSDRWLDGWVRTYEVRRNPIHEVESVWRR
jgi:hypothetical protein